MADTVKKVTKKDCFNVILDILDLAEDNGFELSGEVTFDMLRERMNKEIENLDKKTADAKKRAAAKKEKGDVLREKIFDILSTEEFMSTDDIKTKLNDTDVSPQMITSRMADLIDLGRVEKEVQNIPATAEGGKSRKATCYRALA